MKKVGSRTFNRILAGLLAGFWCLTAMPSPAVAPAANPSWLMLQSTEKPAAAYPHLKLWGLINAVYEDVDGVAPPTRNFSLRRAYLGMRGALDPDIDYFLLADFGTGVAGRDPPLLLDASITFKHLPYLKVRLGQFKIPFGLEGLEAHFAPPLINFTRAAVQLLAFTAPLHHPPLERRASNSAFRDIGVQLFDEIALGESSLVWALGAFNGAGINRADDNAAKDAVARIEWAAGGWRAGASGLRGDATPAETRKTRWGADVTYHRGPWHLGAEYIGACDALPGGGQRRAEGWHVRASYLLTPKLQLVARHEAFDPDRNAGNDRYTATAAGVNWIFTGFTRLQLNYEFRDNAAVPREGDAFFVQAQVLF
jgi:phosphate-selective porin